MEWFSQDRFEVRLEWGLSAVDYLAGKADCAVIVARFDPKHKRWRKPGTSIP